MKKEEKSKISCEKILNAAIAEFGTKSYSDASLNTICNSNQISKGLIYHNFKNKDELYLRCLEVCFTEFTAFLQKACLDTEDFHENTRKLLELRNEFFTRNPYYSNIFFHSIFQPPRHLLKEIRNIRREFDNFHAGYYRKTIESITLRKEMDEETAMEYFFIFQEMFNCYFQVKAYETSDFYSLVADHETKLPNMLDIILYGIAEKERNV